MATLSLVGAGSKGLRLHADCSWREIEQLRANPGAGRRSPRQRAKPTDEISVTRQRQVRWWQSKTIRAGLCRNAAVQRRERTQHPFWEKGRYQERRFVHGYRLVRELAREPLSFPVSGCRARTSDSVAV